MRNKDYIETFIIGMLVLALVCGVLYTIKVITVATFEVVEARPAKAIEKIEEDALLRDTCIENGFDWEYEYRLLRSRTIRCTNN